MHPDYNPKTLSSLDDDEGLFGFYGSEVIKQIDLARKKKCHYCGMTGASVRCAEKRCNVTMHFQCGIERGATFQFHTKNMYVFCAKVKMNQFLLVCNIIYILSFRIDVSRNVRSIRHPQTETASYVTSKCH